MFGVRAFRFIVDSWPKLSTIMKTLSMPSSSLTNTNTLLSLQMWHIHPLFRGSSLFRSEVSALYRLRVELDQALWTCNSQHQQGQFLALQGGNGAPCSHPLRLLRTCLSEFHGDNYPSSNLSANFTENLLFLMHFLGTCGVADTEFIKPHSSTALRRLLPPTASFQYCWFRRKPQPFKVWHWIFFIQSSQLMSQGLFHVLYFCYLRFYFFLPSILVSTVGQQNLLDSLLYLC